MLATAVPFMSRHPALYDQAAFETRWMGLRGFGLDGMVLGVWIWGWEVLSEYMPVE